jgi:N,N'-diacetyllegionaminate synthase
VDALFGQNGADPNPEIHAGVKPLEFDKDQFAQIKKWCDEENIEFMCSVFDEERLQWMEDLGVKRHKIASRTAKLDRDLAQKIVDTGKECYMSLGFDAKPLGGNSKSLNTDQIKYLYCVSEYPTEYSSLNLPEKFFGLGGEPHYYGFSDHTLGIGASLMAVARGAMVIEKHFTLDKSAVGFDHICSCTPNELKDLVKYSRQMDIIFEGRGSNG